MVAKIVKGQSFKGVINYVLDKAKQTEILAAEGIRTKSHESVIDYVKIVDRTQTTSWIKYVVAQYMVGKYDGNILDLTCNFTRIGIDEISNDEVAKLNMTEVISDRKQIIHYRDLLPELMRISIDREYSFLSCNRNCNDCSYECNHAAKVNFDSHRREIVLKQLEYLEREYLFCKPSV